MKKIEPAHIIQARSGDRSCQEMIFKSLSPLIMSICRRYLRNEAEAEDAMIESMYIVLSKLCRFKQGKSLEAWSSRITINHCISQLRKRKGHKIQLDDNYLGDHNQTNDLHDLSHLKQLISGLPDGYRIIFNLIEIDGYSHKEVSKILGITENTSRSQLSRSKLWLMNNLGYE